MRRLCRIVLALATLVAVPNCVGTIGGPGSSGSTFTIEAVGLSGVTAEPCAVSVGQAGDEDGADDTTWQVRFDLDGEPRMTSLPVDDGGAGAHTLKVSATRGDGQTSYRNVHITFVE